MHFIVVTALVPMNPDPPVIKIRILKLLLFIAALHIQWPYGKARVLSGESMRILHVIPFVALRHMVVAPMPSGNHCSVHHFFAFRVTVLTGEVSQ